MLANFAVSLPLALQLTIVRSFIQNILMWEHYTEYICAFEEHFFCVKRHQLRHAKK